MTLDEKSEDHQHGAIPSNSCTDLPLKQPQVHFSSKEETKRAVVLLYVNAPEDHV